MNWEHPDIVAEYEATLRFWFDRGVDGFRIDVATGLVKAAGYPGLAAWRAANPAAGPVRSPFWDQPGVHAIWRSWRRLADTYTPPRAFVGEVWVDSPEVLAGYLRPDELHTAFTTDYLFSGWDGPRLREVITATRSHARPLGAAMTWALDNHDVMRSRTRFGLHAAGSRTGLDERPDVAPDDVRGLARARAALLFMLGLPGSAYLYQGQELGLPEVLDLPAEVRQDPAFVTTAGRGGLRDGVRVPIPWDRTAPAFGFSATGRSWLPMPATWGDLSVAAQAGDPDSTLELTRRALHLRRREPALGDGDLTWLTSPSQDCLVLWREDPRAAAPGVVVAMNLGARAAQVPAAGVLLASGPLEPVEDGYLLPPDTAAWLRPA